MQDSPSKTHILEGEQLTSLKSHFLRNNSVFLLATRQPCSSSRRGPWLWPWGSRWRSEWRSAIPVFSFHPYFSCWFKGSTMRTFSSSFGFVAMRFAGLSPQAEGRTQGSQSKGRWTSRERARWQGSFLSCGEVPLVGAMGGWPVGSPWGLAHPLTQGV